MSDITPTPQHPLFDYLAQRATPEFGYSIRRAIDLLITVRGQDEIEESIDRLLGLIQKDEYNDNPLSDIESSVRNWMISTISQYAIIIDEEITEEHHFGVLSDILFALQTFETYEDMDTLYHTLGLSGTLKEIFANLTSIVTGRDSNQFLEIISGVSPELMTGISDIIRKGYKEEQLRLESEAKQYKEDLTYTIRQKRQALQDYIAKICDGNEENIKWFNKFTTKLIQVPADELNQYIWNMVSAKSYTINQQVGLWCISIHMANFLDTMNQSSVTPTERYKTTKEFIRDVYTDANVLFTISHRIDEVING